MSGSWSDVRRRGHDVLFDDDDDLVRDFVDFLGQRRRTVRRCFCEACEHKAGDDPASDEQAGIAARQRTRVIDEIVDAAIAQSCRKIADGARDAVRQIGERGFDLAELRTAALERLCDAVDPFCGRALALLDRAEAVVAG